MDIRQGDIDGAHSAGLRHIGVALIGLALLGSLSGMVGWILDVPPLRDFGVAHAPIRPLPALCFALVSLGFLAMVTRRSRLALLLWLIPLSAMLATIAANAGLSYGPPDAFRRLDTSTVASLTFLIVSGMLMLNEGWRRSQLTSLLASCALGLGMAASLLALLSLHTQHWAPLFVSSLPAGLIGVTLSTALLLLQADFGWVRMLASTEREWRVLRLIMPLMLVLPALPSLLESWLVGSGRTSPYVSELLVVLGNVLIVALLIHWTATRASRDAIALRHSEERLAVAVSAHGLGVFESDMKGSLVWSAGTAERLGFAPGTLETLAQWSAYVDPEDLAAVHRSADQAKATRADKYGFRYRFDSPNLGLRVMEGTARLFYDAAGVPIRAVGVSVDVTDQGRREAALRSREAQLRSVLETVPNAMVVVDVRGMIRAFSRVAEDMWGYTATDVLGRSFTMLLPETEHRRYADALRSYRETDTAAFLKKDLFSQAEAADGRRFPTEMRIGLVRTEEDHLFTVFLRDLSDQLATQQRLSDLSAELAHVSRQGAMSELAADLAHELNQPLSAASNFIGAADMLLASDAGRDRSITLVRQAGEQVLRAGAIIRRLRDFTSRQEVDRRVESVAETIREAVDLVLVDTAPDDIRLTYALDTMARTMFADRVQVQQVLVNLLRNAREALEEVPAGPHEIRIASRAVPGGMIEIEVRDTGPGVPESLLSQLYTRFVTTKESNGMGIGLSISKRIVEAHGGTLTATNMPGGGASMRFTVPNAIEETMAA